MKRICEKNNNFRGRMKENDEIREEGEEYVMIG